MKKETFELFYHPPNGYFYISFDSGHVHFFVIIELLFITARLIQGEYRTPEEVRAALSACVKLNSVQVRALLSPIAPPEMVEAAVDHARALADELYRADGREVSLANILYEELIH